MPDDHETAGTTRVQLPLLSASVAQAPAASRSVPECYDDVCITCSDEAVPVTVMEMLEDELARVDTGQSIEVVSVALVDAHVGDVILVHAKEAIAVVNSP
jgi:hydrogenase expression/formation protein HypC